jgi:subtilisin family serine protease
MPDARPAQVAVIDSGIHPDHPHIDATRLLPGVSVDAEGMVSPGALDQLGHGTAVAAAILEKAPQARLLPVRLFQDRLSTNGLALSAAIDWCVAQGGMDIINLSLGLPAHGPVPPPLLARAVRRAMDAGIVLIAAREAGGQPCWPGAMDGVLGVGLDWDVPREGWGRRDDGVLVASGYPRPIPGVAPRRNLYGISFAVAQMSGFACRMLPGLRHEEDRTSLLAAQLLNEADPVETARVG